MLCSQCSGRGCWNTNAVHSSKHLAYPWGLAGIEVPLTRQHLFQNLLPEQMCATYSFRL